MKLYLTKIDQNEIEIEVNPTYTILHGKWKIEQLTSIPSKNQYWIRYGYNLDDFLSFDEYKIDSDTVLYLQILPNTNPVPTATFFKDKSHQI